MARLLGRGTSRLLIVTLSWKRGEKPLLGVAGENRDKSDEVPASLSSVFFTVLRIMLMSDSENSWFLLCFYALLPDIFNFAVSSLYRNVC